MDIHIFDWYNTDCGGEIVAYSKAGMKAVDKYVRENYDRIGIKVPKGRKSTRLYSTSSLRSAVFFSFGKAESFSSLLLLCNTLANFLPSIV